jgi:hypothetical protein
MGRDGWSRVEPDVHTLLSACEDFAARHKIDMTAAQSGDMKIRGHCFTYCISYNPNGTLKHRRIKLSTEEECDVVMCADDQPPAFAGYWQRLVG